MSVDNNQIATDKFDSNALGLESDLADADDIKIFMARGGVRAFQCLCITLLLAGVFFSFQATRDGIRIPTGPVIVGLTLVCLVLLHRQQIHAAVSLLMWGTLAVCLVAPAMFSGLGGMVLSLLPVLAMAGAILLGTRQGWLMAATAVTGVLLLLALSHFQLLPKNLEYSPEQYAFTYVAAILIGAFLGINATASFREQYRQAVSLSARLAVQVDELTRSEERVNELNVELESRVEKRTAELQQTLTKLKGAQEELIHAETLASLGAMVAGISHELNTPIGNSLTVATTLQQRVDEMNAKVQTGALKRSALDAFFVDAKEMSDLIVRSAARASTLIASFKQVAIDQTSERRRKFELHSVTQDILSTLHPGLKRSPWLVEDQVAEGLLCDGFPGPLGQILTNLVQNATVHAFEGRATGKITVGAEIVGSDVFLTVTDNGNGMDANILAHIFDPFFTTKLGKGGSGLGLSICHRIAYSVLGGELKVSSTSGHGACFTLRFPRVAPGRIG
jgi:signal transduction histidine kinase